MQDINTWVIISAFLAAGLSGSLFGQLYWRRKFRHSERGRLERETRFRDLETRVNTLQLETLDARLNPHLFKNVLNSIQSHAFRTYFALNFIEIDKAGLIAIRNVQFFSHDQITSALLRNGKPLIFTLSPAFRNDFPEKVRL